jgi:DNA polymerase III gamma/tau subunit
MRDLLEMSESANLLGGLRVFIFDEAHRLSKNTQDLMLKYLEDGPDDVYYIICTSEPEKMLKALRRRAGSGSYRIKALSPETVVVLVRRLLKKVGSELSADALADELNDKEIRAAGFIAIAVEQYVAGASPEEAVDEAATAGLDSLRLCRAVANGDWKGVTIFLRKVSNADAKILRLSIVGFLRKILLDSSTFDSRTKAVASAIKQLSHLTFTENLVQMTTLAAELYTICEMFSKWR